MGGVERPKRSVGALIYREAKMSKTDIESISDDKARQRKQIKNEHGADQKDLGVLNLEVMLFPVIAQTG